MDWLKLVPKPHSKANRYVRYNERNIEVERHGLEITIMIFPKVVIPRDDHKMSANSNQTQIEVWLPRVFQSKISPIDHFDDTYRYPNWYGCKEPTYLVLIPVLRLFQDVARRNQACYACTCQCNDRTTDDRSIVRYVPNAPFICAQAISKNHQDVLQPKWLSISLPKKAEVSSLSRLPSWILLSWTWTTTGGLYGRTLLPAFLVIF